MEMQAELAEQKLRLPGLEAELHHLRTKNMEVKELSKKVELEATMKLDEARYKLDDVQASCAV